MLMVTVGSFIAGRWVFRDGFRTVGWRWGSAGSWALALGLPLLIWVVPAGLDLLVGARTPAPSQWNTVTLTVFTIVFSPFLGFGEEFGFRGYLLPRLWWMGPRRAVLVNGIIWWAWHYILVLLSFIIQVPTVIYQQGISAVTGLLAIMLFLTVLHFVRLICLGVIFSYVWVRSESIAVASGFHAAYDTVRNMVSLWLVGSSLTAGWMPFVLDFPLPFLFELVLAVLLLWRGRWALPAETGACD